MTNNNNLLTELVEQINSNSKESDASTEKNEDISDTENVHVPNDEDYVWNEQDENIDQDESEEEKENLTAADFIGPETALAFMNFLIPMGIVIILRAVGYKSRRKDFELTAGERKIIERPLSLALKAIKINFNNPFVMLGVTIGCVYGAKVFDKFDTFEKVQPKKPKNDKNASGVFNTDNDNVSHDTEPKEKVSKSKGKKKEQPVNIDL